MFSRIFHPRDSKPAPQRPRAFTLIELLIVMIIIAVMTAVTAPKLIAFAMGRKANDAARNFVTLARYARTEAISEGRIYHLNVDNSNTSFWLTAQDPESGQYVAPNNDFGNKVALPDNVKMETDIAPEQDGTYLVFNSTGLAQPATIHFTDIGSRAEITVACYSATELFHVVQPGEVAP